MSRMINQNIESQIVNITAEYAEALLSNRHDEQLRRRNDRHVKKLARLMETGQWQNLNGDTIVIDTDGKVIDGQHRLLAVMESKSCITTHLITGVKPEAFYSIDLQSRPRSLADVLSIEGYSDSSTLATASRYMWYYRRDIRPDGASTITPSIRELSDEVKSKKSLYVESLIPAKKCHKKKLLSAAQASFLYAVFAEIDANKTKEYFRQLTDGLGFVAGNPIQLLRDRLLYNSTAKAKISRVEVLALCILAWNAWNKKKSLKRLSWKANNKGQRRFPTAL